MFLQKFDQITPQRIWSQMWFIWRLIMRKFTILFALSSYEPILTGCPADPMVE